MQMNVYVLTKPFVDNVKVTMIDCCRKEVVFDGYANAIPDKYMFKLIKSATIVSANRVKIVIDSSIVIANTIKPDVWDYVNMFADDGYTPEITMIDAETNEVDYVGYTEYMPDTYDYATIVNVKIRSYSMIEVEFEM